MSLFDLKESGPTAADLARGFLKEADQGFAIQREAAYDAVQRFWFRNKDQKGRPSPVRSETDPQPTGVEILEAAGTSAQLLMAAAWARVEPLLALAELLKQPGLVDLTQLTPPYSLTFGEDGSLTAAELTYVAPPEPEPDAGQ